MNRSPTRKPVSIGRILERFGTSEHSDIPHKVRALAVLENRVLSLLPPEFAPHCRVAGLTGGRLLEQTAKGIQDPRLAQALTRLARRAR